MKVIAFIDESVKKKINFQKTREFYLKLQAQEKDCLNKNLYIFCNYQF